MEEKKHMGKITRLTVCAIIVATLSMPAFALTENIKVSPLKSFFTRFVKPKADKAEDKKSTKSAVANKTKASEKADNTVSTVTGGISMSIDDCVNLALKNDPNIRIYKDTQNAQKSLVGQAKSNYFPRIFGGTGYNINNTNYSDSAPSINNNYYGLNLGINQLVWDFGWTTARINMSKYNYEASGFDLENVILNSIYNVRIDYTAVLAARANEDIYERSVKINELNVERTRAMYDVGLKSKIDVVNAEVYLTNAKIDLLTAQNTYQTALINLNNSMYYLDAPEYSIKDTETFNFQKNYSAKNEINVAYDRKNYDDSSIEAELKDGAILTSGVEKRNILKSYTFKPFDLSMSDAILKAYENRPDLKALNLVKKASEESLKSIKRSYMPAVNASANYSFAGHSDYNANAVGVYAGLNLPSNVNAMAIKYQIDQGKSYLDIAISNVDMLKKNIYFQVQGYYVNMKQLEKRIPLMAKNVEATLENFELADGRYAVGLGNYLELQQAQTNYNNAQLAFVQSVFDYNQARYYLEKSIGMK